MEMNGRGFHGDYRFGYQGSEKDNEVSGDGNSYTTEFRQLDPRLGRWFSVDPVFQPWQSPYTSMDNNPIGLNDPMGLRAGDELVGQWKSENGQQINNLYKAKDGTYYVETSDLAGKILYTTLNVSYTPNPQKGFSQNDVTYVGGASVVLYSEIKYVKKREVIEHVTFWGSLWKSAKGAARTSFDIAKGVVKGVIHLAVNTAYVVTHIPQTCLKVQNALSNINSKTPKKIAQAMDASVSTPEGAGEHAVLPAVLFVTAPLLAPEGVATEETVITVTDEVIVEEQVTEVVVEDMGAEAAAGAEEISMEAPVTDEIYKRPSNATTPLQRKSVQDQACVDCGSVGQQNVADHKYPLVKEHYETGRIDKKRMRSLDAVQPQCPTCSSKQGAQMSAYSRKMKNIILNRLRN